MRVSWRVAHLTKASGAPRAFLLLAVLLALAATARADGPIQDNSFLLEEAYNQDPGVVQHISLFLRDASSHDWIYSFTQEWPAPGLRHQLSISLPYARTGGERGAGDVALNYRLQLVGDADAAVALAPRLTLLLPTGDERKGLGSGGAGVQAALPASFVVTPRFVAHFNMGATFTPRARDDIGDHAATWGYYLGQSAVWLAAARVNVLVEALWTRSESVVGPRRTERSDDLVISPGIRWSHDFASGLQIVPGVAYVMGAGPSSGEHSALLYLSFEHPFRRRRD